MIEIATMDHLKSYLQQLADMGRVCFHANRTRKEPVYKSQYELVLAKGLEFSSEPLTDKEREIVLEAVKKLARWHYPQIKQCFHNSYWLAKVSKGALKYVEGWSYRLIGVHHAWNTLNGKVIDTTWREITDSRKSIKAIMDRIDRNQKENPYLGIVIPMEYMTRLWELKTSCASAIDDYVRGWPLVQKGTSVLEE